MAVPTPTRADTGACNQPLGRFRLVVRGMVQGIGFRPYVFRLATAYRLNGWVINSTEGVLIEIEGEDAQLQGFVDDLPRNAPSRALIDRIDMARLPLVGYQRFAVQQSDAAGSANVLVSPDIATCGDCLRELLDPGDRRRAYPFVNCTNCGPRFTIIERTPYDRINTTMKAFAMCPSCAAEYADPANRRFHAQPNACPTCGPHVWIETSEAIDSGAISGRRFTARPYPADPISAARQAITEGRIIAIKGLGGFHLACDATNHEAVARLRLRKHRIDKPFAVMFPSTDSVADHCVVSESERQLLVSPQRPIVLLQRRETSPLSSAVAPGNARLGAILPYTPLHTLLLTRWLDQSALAPSPPPLVMTSGNYSEEPLAIDNDEARVRLGPLADVFIMHDRDIHVRCDDSVTEVFEGAEIVVRRSRGYAPLPLRLARPVAQHILSCGAELKNTVCLARDDYAFVSQHIGDTHNLATRASMEQAVEHLGALFTVNPQVVAHDLHPDYLSTIFAQQYASQCGLPATAVQHHEAHIASCLADNQFCGSAIGVALDGAGLGRDGTIWGGEIFVGPPARLRRVAHLLQVPMPGGEAAIRSPLRMAYSYLHAAGTLVGSEIGRALTQRLGETEAAVVDREVRRGFNAPLTSSCGRLFDSVSALLGIRDRVNYEGQAAIELETAAAGSHSRLSDSYQWGLHSPQDQPMVIDTLPIIRGVVADITTGQSVQETAARFHYTIAKLIADMCVMISERYGLDTVALSGGVFQNRLLLSLTVSLLREKRLKPLLHHQVPTNDGGISLGQMAIVSAQYQEG